MGVIQTTPFESSEQHMEGTIQQSQEWLFQSMFEQATIGIAYAALDGQLKLVNQRYCEIVGHTREELLARSYQDITHPDDIEINAAYLQSIVAQGPQARSLEKRYIRKDGSLVWASLSVSLVPESSGAPQYFIAFIEDITKRKQAEEERRQLERRTHEALHALLAMAEALVLVPNSAPAAEVPGQVPSGEHKALPFNLADRSGSRASGVAEPQDASHYKALAERAVTTRLAELTRDVLGCQRVAITSIEPQTHEPLSVAVVGLSAEQEQRWRARAPGFYLSSLLDPTYDSRLQANEVLILDMTQPPLSNQPNPFGIQIMLLVPMRVGNQLVGVLSLDHGGTKHEYTQEEIMLAGAVARLAGLVIERERLLRERAEARANELALRQANQRMDEFLSIACHELRTPLAAIKGNVQLAEHRSKRLAHNAETQIDELLSQLLESANRQADRLDRLVSDLLDVSRIRAERLEMRLEPCDLTTIVREAVQEQLVISPTRPLRLELLAAEEDPLQGDLATSLAPLPADQQGRKEVPIYADAGRIGQVVTNYLNNAFKYSPVDKPVIVFLEMDGVVARLSVRDKGIGLPIKEQEQIWERFHRVQGIEVQSGSGVGLGLGLYISKTIIEAHHGHVGVESTPGKGSTFWFTLPIKSEI